MTYSINKKESASPFGLADSFLDIWERKKGCFYEKVEYALIIFEGHLGDHGASYDPWNHVFEENVYLGACFYVWKVGKA